MLNLLGGRQCFIGAYGSLETDRLLAATRIRMQMAPDAARPVGRPFNT
jgi:hypothetical protein